MKHKLIILFLFGFLLPLPSFSQNQSSSSPSCPLDLSILQKFVFAAVANPSWIPTNTPSRCSYALRYLHLAEAQYLHTESLFFSPSNSSSCWSSLSSLLSLVFPYSFSLLDDCGFGYQSLYRGCMNITSRADFESHIPRSAIADMDRNCRPSLDASDNACSACTMSVNHVKSYLSDTDTGNITTCSDYPYIYAAGVVNLFGSADDGTASCLFSLSTKYDNADTGGRSSAYSWLYGLSAGSLVLAILIGLGVWFLVRRRERKIKIEKKLASIEVTNVQSNVLDSMAASTTLIKFQMEDIRAATKNFSRDNIIGRGGYGYVYRGFLNGSEVALKRYKNCSAGGDASFEHEVEVIASVRHVNLVALRGYCTATTAMEGHQRIIVCELMKNGSLQDHLFGSEEGKRLSWPIRRRIAVGTARALAYLHYGAQPAIIHRDIKGANILLDESFEPKVADFGLARFTPEGMSHISTRAAGTLGYVAPEYAMYGQLTEKSDVYSFGVVMLELLSGKKALSPGDNEQNVLVADWAWSLVMTGRVLDVIEEGMEELELKEVMEKYVLLAVLCCHPLMHARPTMDQVVKILETDVVVPSIPYRPFQILANLDHIETSASSSGVSSQLSAFAGYQ